MNRFLFALALLSHVTLAAAADVPDLQSSAAAAAAPATSAINSTPPSPTVAPPPAPPPAPVTLSPPKKRTVELTQDELDSFRSAENLKAIAEFVARQESLKAQDVYKKIADAFRPEP